MHAAHGPGFGGVQLQAAGAARDVRPAAESYVEAYIRSLGRTLADFYEALRELKGGSGAPMLDASDCLDTLYEMEDIRCWIDGVKARVRYKRLHAQE